MRPQWQTSFPAAQRKLIQLTDSSAQSPPNPNHEHIPLTFPVVPLTFATPQCTLLVYGERGLGTSHFSGSGKWYGDFAEEEGEARYTVDAFERFLAPKDGGLVKALAEAFSSLAVHAGANGASGGKVCRGAGFWVLVIKRLPHQSSKRLPLLKQDLNLYLVSYIQFASSVINQSLLFFQSLKCLLCQLSSRNRRRSRTQNFVCLLFRCIRVGNLSICRLGEEKCAHPVAIPHLLQS